jgi:hypothetical protein
MRFALIGLFVAALAAASVVNAQYYGGAWVDNRASTPGQAAAYGMASMARAAGQRNLLNSEAAINMEAARKANMENREQWTNTYFQMRDANKKYRAAESGPKPTMEDLVRYSQAGKPKRLSPSELDTISGEVSWPNVLQSAPYDQYRADLEALLGHRAASGALSFDDQQKLNQTKKAMLVQLKSQIRDMPPQEYTSAKRFVESLAYEARLPTG